MTKILVVDDELDMLILIKNVLKKRNYWIDVYQDPLEIVPDKLNNYDLILLDIMMPNIDGRTFCKNIRQKVDCPIIFLTAKTMEDDIVAGLASGGDDYLTKPFGINELLARVEAHLRREKREHHVALNLGDIRLDLAAHEVFIHEEKVALTKTEYQLCELLARRKGQVFSREQLYEMIFGYDGIGNSATIAEHVKNIRAKFQKHGAQPIETVWGVGYKWK